MPKNSTTAPKPRFRLYPAPDIPTFDTEPQLSSTSSTPGVSNQISDSANKTPAPTDTINETLYRELVRLRNIPRFRKRPLAVLHEDTTTVPTALVFPLVGAHSQTTNSAPNNPAPTPSSELKSLRDRIRLLNRSSEHLRRLGHLNLPPKPSDETLAHTAAQSPEPSRSALTTVRPHLTNLVHPLNQTPRLETPLLTFLPPIPAQVQDAHLVQQEALCHRLDHKDRVARTREETLRSRRASRQSSMRTSVPFTVAEGLAEEVRLMIGPRDARLRPLTEIEASMTDGSMRS